MYNTEINAALSDCWVWDTPLADRPNWAVWRDCGGRVGRTGSGRIMCENHYNAQPDLGQWRINIFTESGEYVDSCDDQQSLESVLYGDLSGVDEPRIVQIRMDDDEALGWAEYLLRINADCFGTADVIEQVLA